MENNQNLKAYVRYDGSNRVVPSSLILRKKKPKVGKWTEIPAYECCNYVPTTTTTTTSPAGPTEYLILELLADPGIPSAFPSTGQACAGWTNPSFSFYSAYAAESSISSVTYLYTDIGLTTPLANTSPSVAYNSIAVPDGASYTTPYSLRITGGNGQVSNLTAC